MTKKSYNKFVATAATATLVASAIAPVAASADSKQFTDVNERYAPAVDYVVSKGVQGKTTTQFGVQDSIKRVDAAVFIANALDLNKPGSPDAGFSDVPARAQDAVNALKAKGIINGKTETRFGANDVLTRGEVALILANAYDLKGDANSVKFTDVNKNRYGAAVAGLVDAGVTQGISETKFGTDNPVKRGDLAVFLYGLSDETPEVPTTDGITSAKAINDTLVEVTFGKEIDRDFIREAELSGKYFVVYTEGETVRGKVTQSEKINFSKDGKSAEFNLEKAIESGKKYYVALLDGENPKVADVVHTYGPTELKAAAETPQFEVSAVADKIYVKYSTKMKDAAKEVKHYTVFDEGGQELGKLADFLEKDSEGKWVNINEKKEVEFQLSKDSDKKLLAGKTYKLVVTDAVKTDDNKTLAEDKRTIKVKTPSVNDASPVAKVARIVNKTTIDLIFDQDIVAPDGKVNLNKAQLNLKTSTGKTVDMDKFDEAVVEGDNKLRITFTEDVFDKGLTYKVDMPANVVQNGIFTNAMNKETTGLTAKAQDNVAISSMKAQIIADPKNDAKADLVLTFNQVPKLSELDITDIVLFDGRDKYILDSDANVKIYGGDIDGKSIIIEGVNNFKMGDEALVVQGDTTYDIEIAKGKLTTDSFDDAVPATNKEKLKASTKGISVSAPEIKKVRMESAEKIEIEFEEDIKGNVKASDLHIDAFVANRSDIFDGESTLKEVSGSGYYDAKINGNKLTITAKEGVKFPTSLENLNITIDKDAFTNTSGKVGNAKMVIADGKFDAVAKKDIIDNAAPVIVSVYAENANTVKVTYSEDVTLQGTDKEIASLFFTDKGENSSIGADYSGNGTDTATITFKENFAKSSTDLSVVTLKYSKGNSYYIQDSESNKMETATIKGFYKDSSSDLGSSNDVDDNDGEDNGNGEDKEVTLTDLKMEFAQIPFTNNIGVIIKQADVPADLKDKTLFVEVDGKEYVFETKGENLAIQVPKAEFNESAFGKAVLKTK